MSDEPGDDLVGRRLVRYASSDDSMLREAAQVALAARCALAASEQRAADLLAALQTIAQQGAREEPDHEPWTGNADDSYDNGYERAKYHVAKIARAAIAKATGETA